MGYIIMQMSGDEYDKLEDIHTLVFSILYKENQKILFGNDEVKEECKQSLAILETLMFTAKVDE